MFETLSATKMYNALVRKDSSFEGIFFAAVKTTGIFCRPTCRARKPKKTNVEFFRTANQALQHGYRACKVCVPMAQQSEAPEWLTKLLTLANESEGLRMGDKEIRECGVDPHRVRRWFQKNHKMTFQAYLRSLRVGQAFGHLTQGGKVVDAAFTNGYDSLSGFTTAFKKLTGKAPAKSKDSEIISVYPLVTPLGPMLAGSVKGGICLLEFRDRRMLEREMEIIQKRFKAAVVTAKTDHIRTLEKQLKEYFKGERKDFDLPLSPAGTPFQKAAWDALMKIPYGETRSYRQQAAAVNRATAVRAIARANGDNRIAIIIPCHRVIGSDGSLTGYGGGLERKKFLLDLEKNSRN
jgi:AraC family transcriptional regulator, regulatory protein of adaptative response / methylated-DNA-[protein]-cysteine methyltransferase